AKPASLMPDFDVTEMVPAALLAVIGWAMLTPACCEVRNTLPLVAFNAPTTSREALTPVVVTVMLPLVEVLPFKFTLNAAPAVAESEMLMAPAALAVSEVAVVSVMATAPAALLAVSEAVFNDPVEVTPVEPVSEMLVPN